MNNSLDFATMSVYGFYADEAVLDVNFILGDYEAGFFNSPEFTRKTKAAHSRGH